MTIELTREARDEAIKSIERYFTKHMQEHTGGRIGNIAAGALLGFFVEEVGPVIYNQAVAEVQEKIAMRVSELDIEHHEEEFQYWTKQGAPVKRKR